MKFFSLLLVFSVSLTNAVLGVPEMAFPETFQFGVSTAAFQIEGGAKEDGVYVLKTPGKGESIWDRFTKHLEAIDGDVAADSYHHLDKDVDLLRQLGVDFYKFSISWSRVLPTGFPNKINEAGLKYYDDLLNLLVKYNIDAMAVMYYYDLPQPLQDLGGWTNPESVKWFHDYANILLEKFNDKVKYWITINDPISFCNDGYNGKTPPGLHSKGIGDYMCIKNMLIAHGKVYRQLEKKYKTKAGNQMGFAMNMNTYIPKDHNWNNEENKKTVNTIHRLAYDIFLNPIYGKDGDFPEDLKELIHKKSKADNFFRSRLPSLSKEEVKMLKGTLIFIQSLAIGFLWLSVSPSPYAVMHLISELFPGASDFLGTNHVTSFEVSSSKNRPVDKFPDVTGHISQKDVWKKSVSKDVKMYPYGLYYMWFILQKTYGPIDIFVTEHGWPTGPGLDDQERVYALKEYLKSLLFVLQDAGLSVKGFAVKSLMDGVEWLAGTSERYGLYEVDFSSPNKTRSMRSSAMFYRHVIESRKVDDQWVYKNLDLDFSNRRTSTNTPVQVKEDMLRIKKIINEGPDVMSTNYDDKIIKRLCNDEL